MKCWFSDVFLSALALSVSSVLVFCFVFSHANGGANFVQYISICYMFTLYSLSSQTEEKPIGS